MVNILWIVIGGVFTVPFFAAGLYYATTWIYHNHLEKKGYVKVGLVKENFQKYDIYVKPTDGEFKLKFGNEERKYEFDNNPGICLIEGRKLYAIFDEKSGKQLDFRTELKDSDANGMSTRDVNTVCDRVFNLGFIMGRKQTEQGIILIWIILGVVVLIGGFVFFKFGNLEAGMKLIADKIGTTLPGLVGK